MTDGTQNAPDVTPDLRLRPERPQVTRLSRKVLIGLGAVSGLAIAAALIYALQTRRADQDIRNFTRPKTVRRRMA
jgi:type IV secretion system protein VirB10